MEQHPVPQDVTGFEFKLIGDMTLKQFGFLALGFIVAYLIFKTTIVPGLFRIPLAFLVGLSGVAIAFLPIEGRSLDRWILAFFMRVYQPTQYIWRKHASPPDILLYLIQAAPTPLNRIPMAPRTEQQKLTEYLGSLSHHVPTRQPTAGDPDEERLKKIAAIFGPPQTMSPVMPEIHANLRVSSQSKNVTGTPIRFVTTPVTSSIPPSTPSSEVIEQKTTELTTRIATLQKELGTQTITKERFLELQKELIGLLQEKESLLQELVSLRKQLEEKKQTHIVKPTEAVDTESHTTVSVMSAQTASKKGLPRLTSYPNVITGIIRTAEGEMLPNILVTVKDKEEMSVRALKTNKLGQFAASAPLANGTYTLEIEDPQKRYQFDLVQIALSGVVLPPIEITAKSKKTMLRAQLHKELFGNPNM